jgi:hypothetical protein
MKLDVLIINYVDELDVKEIQCFSILFSLEDDLIKVLEDSIRRWVEYLIQDKDVPLESDLLTKV